MKIHFIIHESYESPGAIEVWAKSGSYEVDYSRVYLGDELPVDPEFDMLIVMGGPQSPATTIEECSHYNAKAEIELIKKAVEADKIVFGVCLGSQLIGEAMGAEFGHSPQKEVGNFPISLTEAGKKNNLTSHFPNTFMSGHWHGDMPGLTKDSKILAYSEGCPRQIIEFAPKVYGFQCHMEFTKENIEDMIKNVPDDFNSEGAFIQSPDEFKNYDFSEMNTLLFEFLNKLVAFK